MQDITLLILGHGYLGSCYRLQYSPVYTRVQVTCRSADKVRALQEKGVAAYQVDINDRTSWQNLAIPGNTRLHVCVFVPPRNIDRAALTGFIQRLQVHGIDAGVLVSSTVVYGNTERQVDSDSAVLLDSERANRQFAIEQAVQREFPAVAIVRLAGIYGSGRVIGEKILREGAVLPGEPDGWLNLIHVGDAATLVHAAMQHTGPVLELGSDGHPLRRDDYYNEIAGWLGTDAPRFRDTGDGTGRGRRCNNSLTRKRLGWEPRYRSFQMFMDTVQ